MNDLVITVTLVLAGIGAVGTLLTGIAAIITALAQRHRKPDEKIDDPDEDLLTR